MTEADLLICGDYVLTMNSEMELINGGAIAIKGGEIVAVGKEVDVRANYYSDKIVEGRQRVLLPGLINTHTHAAMVYFRGIADDLPLKQWLEQYIWPTENAMVSPEFVAASVELACLEMIKAGVTTYNDMYFFGEAAAASTIKAGIRALIGVAILDFPTASAKTKEDYFRNAQRMIEQFRRHELITPCVAPHALYTCSRETLKDAQELAEKEGLPIHIHLSETQWEVSEMLSRYGQRPVHYLNSIGFLSDRVIAAHCVWLEDSEIELMAKNNVGIAHCIESNLKLASGIAPLPQLIRGGVKVGLGTDGAASNNDLSILGEMSTAAKVHKVVAKDPTVIDAKTALLMATRWGAEVLGLDGRIGSLEVGKEADIISINLQRPHLTPIYDIYSHIVYASMASDVDMVCVRGRLLMKDREVLTLDEEGIITTASKWCKRVGEIVKHF